MDTLRKTAVIIPCYNEAHRIQEKEFLHYCELIPHVSFIFVDDCSEDNTGPILHKLQNSNPQQISIIKISKNFGKAEAVRQGVLSAIKDKFDYIGYWDADLSTPLPNITTFITELNESPKRDIVMGSRVRLLGRSIYRQPLRHYLGRLFATIASIVLYLPVYDTQCGAKLFRNKPFLHQIFSEPFKTRWVFDVEIIARYLSGSNEDLKNIITEKILEHPLEVWIDAPGSKMRITDFFASGLDLARIWFRYHKELAPIKQKQQRVRKSGCPKNVIL